LELVALLARLEIEAMHDIAAGEISRCIARYYHWHRSILAARFLPFRLEPT
jgi:hypothetical protein